MAFKVKREKDFGLVPNREIERSGILTEFNNKSTFNVGKLVPLAVKDVLPGDIVKANLSYALRTSTPIAPTMDNLYFETWSFFVPNRILMNNWERLQGENTTGKWQVDGDGTDGVVPEIVPPRGGWDVGSIAEHMGLPIGVDHKAVNHMPIRAYVKIWNDYFRDQNNQVPAFTDFENNSLTTGTTASAGFPVSNAWKGGDMLPVSKFYDYFTYALPAPQKADDVLVPIGTVAPLVLGATTSTPFTGSVDFKNPDGSPYSSSGDLRIDNGTLRSVSDSTSTGSIVAPANLYADLSQASGVSINTLRELIAFQHIYESDARHGTRYFERLESKWGITGVNGRLDRPELIGRYKTLVDMTQVAQTSSTDSATPQGNTAGYSLTNDNSSGYVNYAVKEHGYIITLGTVRPMHTYSYGFAKHWSRKERFDFFEPELANIAEQPIYNREIYADGSDNDDKVFGYRPAWDGYRHDVSIVTGDFRPNSPKSLDVWTYADKFDNLPILGDDFIRENLDNVDRTLAVQAQSANQLILDFMLVYDCDRPLPMTSIPGIERI